MFIRAKISATIHFSQEESQEKGNCAPSLSFLYSSCFVFLIKLFFPLFVFSH